LVVYPGASVLGKLLLCFTCGSVLLVASVSKLSGISNMVVDPFSVVILTVSVSHLCGVSVLAYKKFRETVRNPRKSDNRTSIVMAPCGILEGFDVWCEPEIEVPVVDSVLERQIVHRDDVMLTPVRVVVDDACIYRYYYIDKFGVSREIIDYSVIYSTDLEGEMLFVSSDYSPEDVSDEIALESGEVVELPSYQSIVGNVIDSYSEADIVCRMSSDSMIRYFRHGQIPVDLLFDELIDSKSLIGRRYSSSAVVKVVSFVSQLNVLQLVKNVWSFVLWMLRGLFVALVNSNVLVDLIIIILLLGFVSATMYTNIETKHLVSRWCSLGAMSTLINMMQGADFNLQNQRTEIMFFLGVYLPLLLFRRKNGFLLVSSSRCPILIGYASFKDLLPLCLFVVPVVSLRLASKMLSEVPSLSVLKSRNCILIVLHSMTKILLKKNLVLFGRTTHLL